MPRSDHPEPSRQEVKPWPVRREHFSRVQKQEWATLAAVHQLQGRARDRYRLGHPTSLGSEPGISSQPSDKISKRLRAIAKRDAISRQSARATCGRRRVRLQDRPAIRHRRGLCGARHGRRAGLSGGTESAAEASLRSQPVPFTLTKPRSLLAKAPLSRPPFLDALVCHTRNDRARRGDPGSHRCNLRRAAILDKNLRLSAETLNCVRVSTPARRSTTKEFFW